MNIKVEETTEATDKALPVTEDNKTEVSTEEKVEASDNKTEEPGEEVVISIEGESPTPNEAEEKAPEWVKQLRKDHKELVKRNRELEEQIKVTTPVKQEVTLGEKPTLENCDYDADKFEAELLAYQERKLKVASDEKAKKEANDKINAEWQNSLATYKEASTKLGVKNFVDAEDFVRDTLSVMQQGIVVSGASNPALVVYAIGTNPKHAQALAKITDPIKFAFAIAKLEGTLKVTKREAPQPEKAVRSGGAPISGTVDATLERLRAEAEKSGNYSKVVAYKNQLKAKGK